MLGPSGSGKTTSLKILAGFEEAGPRLGVLGRTGHVGHSAGAAKYRRRFPELLVFPHLSVAANVGFPLRMRGMAKARRRRGDPRGARPSGVDRVRASHAEPIVGRPTAACRDRPGHRLSARLSADGRAARRARPTASRRHATRDQGAARTIGNHGRLCHARPGRSFVDERSRRRAQCGPHRAGRTAARSLPAIPPPCLSPIFSANSMSLSVYDFRWMARIPDWSRPRRCVFRAAYRPWGPRSCYGDRIKWPSANPTPRDETTFKVSRHGPHRGLRRQRGAAEGEPR